MPTPTTPQESDVQQVDTKELEARYYKPESTWREIKETVKLVRPEHRAVVAITLFGIVALVAMHYSRPTSEGPLLLMLIVGMGLIAIRIKSRF